MEKGGAAISPEGVGLVGLSPVAGEFVDPLDRAGFLLRQNRKSEAAGANGGQELFGAIGGEDEERVVGRFLQGFEKSVGRLGRREAHSFRFQNQGNFDRSAVGFAGEGVLELTDLGDRDATRFRFRTKNKKVGVSLQLRIEKVSG